MCGNFCCEMNKEIKLTNGKVPIVLLSLVTWIVKVVDCVTSEDKARKKKWKEVKYFTSTDKHLGRLFVLNVRNWLFTVMKRVLWWVSVRGKITINHNDKQIPVLWVFPASLSKSPFGGPSKSLGVFLYRYFKSFLSFFPI